MIKSTPFRHQWAAPILCACRIITILLLLNTFVFASQPPLDFNLTLLSGGLNDSQPAIINGDNVLWIGRTGTTDNVYQYQISTGIRTILSNTPTNPSFTALQGNYAAWDGSGIYLRNLSLNTTTTITNEPRSSSPMISGNNLVWLESRAQDSLRRVMRYDTNTQTSQQLLNFGSYNDLRLSDNNLVWDARTGSSPNTAEIYNYNLQSAITTRLTTNSIPDVYPAISGSNIVWQTYDTESSAEIFRYNLQTSTLERLTTNSVTDHVPEISGTNVVWQRITNTVDGSVGNIFTRDLNTGITTALTSSTLYPESYGTPKVNGSSVVWNAQLTTGLSNYEIYFHDLDSDVTSRVTNNSFREQDADVFGTNVVFRRETPNGSNQWAVYLATPVPEPSTLALVGISGLSILVYFNRRRQRQQQQIHRNFGGNSEIE